MTKSRIITVLIIVCSILWTSVCFCEEDFPIAVSIILNKAQNLSNQKKINEAVKVLSEFQDKRKEVDIKTAQKKGYLHYYIDYAKGNYLLMLSKPKQAIPSYKAAVDQKKDFSEAWLNLAKCHYDIGDMKPAGDAFLKGYETSLSKDAKHLYYSVVCYATSSNYKKAYDIFNKLLTNHPDKITLEWKETLVQILLSLKKPKQALLYIEELAKKSSGKKKKEWQEVLLYQYMSMNMTNKALSYAKWLTESDTTEPKWWKALAHLHLQKDQYKDGLVALLVLSFLKPLTPEETALIADINLSLNIPKQAVKFYETLLTDSLKPKILKKIVHSYMRLYDYEKALSWIDKGLKSGVCRNAKPNAQKNLKAELLMLKGKILFESGQFGEAADIFDQINQNGQTNGEALLMLGYAAWNTGKINQAKKAFQKATKYKSQKKQAQKALRQLQTIEH